MACSKSHTVVSRLTRNIHTSSAARAATVSVPQQPLPFTMPPPGLDIFDAPVRLRRHAPLASPSMQPLPYHPTPSRTHLSTPQVLVFSGPAGTRPVRVETPYHDESAAAPSPSRVVMFDGPARSPPRLVARPRPNGSRRKGHSAESRLNLVAVGTGLVAATAISVGMAGS